MRPGGPSIERGAAHRPDIAESSPPRRIVVLGGAARADGEFLLADLPGTSGRIDALLRCLRAGLLVSHGVRRDAVMYLVLGGGEVAPRTLRVRGDAVRFLRPDERSLAVLAQKALRAPRRGGGFVEVRPGVDVADGGLPAVLSDLGASPRFLLDASGEDLRAASLPRDAVFFLGDHLGMPEATQRALAARAISIGPRSVHAEDAVAVLCNELDRRGPGGERV